MRIVIHDGSVGVVDPSVFSRFDVLASASVRSGPKWIDIVQAMLGRDDPPDYVWVDPKKLSELIGAEASTEEWRSGFAAMYEFARQHDWVAGDGHIRAHITEE